MHHFGSRKPSDRIILSQKDGLFRTDLFAEPAIDAANHIDFELFRIFFYLSPAILLRYFSGLNCDCSGRAYKLAELAGNTPFPTVVIRDQSRGAAIMGR